MKVRKMKNKRERKKVKTTKTIRRRVTIGKPLTFEERGGRKGGMNIPFHVHTHRYDDRNEEVNIIIIIIMILLNLKRIKRYDEREKKNNSYFVPASFSFDIHTQRANMLKYFLVRSL